VHKTVTTGLAAVINHDLSGKNVPELGKGVVQNLVADGLVKVLDHFLGDRSLKQKRGRQQRRASKNNRSGCYASSTLAQTLLCVAVENMSTPFFLSTLLRAIRLVESSTDDVCVLLVGPRGVQLRCTGQRQRRRKKQGWVSAPHRCAKLGPNKLSRQNVRTENIVRVFRESLHTESTQPSAGQTFMWASWGTRGRRTVGAAAAGP
jgi:hypothetical protein